ncbi:MAG TPA: DUF3793 family protein [Candidatus Anaerobutyricum stercoris]|uniref:DUF3793 family protein n=1 Tax=Candidatus Anaerobutyricum stercoris TaxID=2838457 RepID=A0A9D2J7J6_9FIRM|nr:DUF3793 family protein [Eubacterium sp. An3]OUO29475.1 hypothetical protein B5F87_02930 [Eubacterium sp. An3]CVI69317.1 hypothetical protein BN3660_01525 [Eubacteriaceae bacterium CHKCI004]HIZ38574.1 DUF3793 family protein [Candidatus Anaerobutyricum stercoris]
MNRETLKIVQKLDRESLEVQLLLQCAPMIAGLKASNLLIIASENEEDARKILNGTRISCVRLARMDKKTTMLIYHERWLKEYLASEEVIRLLCVLGYEGKGFYEVLHSVKEKYRSYIGKKGDFPHELGLLLGYPAEDVQGYMENKGRNYLCTGYWQVYADPAAKLSLFQKFELARERLIRAIFDGKEIQELIQVAGG